MRRNYNVYYKLVKYSFHWTSFKLFYHCNNHIGNTWNLISIGFIVFVIYFAVVTISMHQKVSLINIFDFTFIDFYENKIMACFFHCTHFFVYCLSAIVGSWLNSADKRCKRPSDRFKSAKRSR